MSEAPAAANDWKKPGLTGSGLIRRGIFALVALASLAALAVAALPMVASTQLVRNRIAIELSAWSGFRVAIASTPQLELWPFKAVLNGVTLYQWGNWNNPAVIEAERVEINLSAIDALNGNVSFTEAKLVNPVIRIGPQQAGSPEPDLITSSGRIAQAVETVRTLVADNPDKPDLSRLPTTPFGAVDIQNGRVVTMVDGQERDVVTRLNGRVDWAALNAGGSASLTGVWRGEQVKVDVSSDSPLALLAGAATRVNASWDSGPLKGSFGGTVRTASDGRVDAHLELDAPSVRRVIGWTGADLAIGHALGALKISSDIEGNRNRITTRNAQITVNESAGGGALSIEPFGQRPKLAGVLAFEQLDMEAFLSMFTPLMSYDRPKNPATDSLADLVDADIKVTAAKATVAQTTLTGVAATVDIDQQTEAFILDSAAGFSGALQGALRFEEKLDQETTEVELTATGVDGVAFAEAAGIPQIVPAAKGDIEFKIVGRSQAIDTMLPTADGEVTAKFGAGELRGIDVSTLISKTSGGGFFPLTEISKGVLAIDAAELDATVQNGVAQISKALVKAGDKTIALSGILPYAGRGVALSGTVMSMDKISLLNPFGREAAFFVGGSWDAPFVSAALPRQLPQ